MLVLSRKLGEKVLIGNEITVTVVSVMGNRVQLGLEAPGNVCILRGELQDRQSTPKVRTFPLEEDLRDKPACWWANAVDGSSRLADALEALCLH